MKVLILTGNYPRKNALNNGVFIHQQVKALQELGVECHVLLLHNWYPPLGLHKYHTYWRQGHHTHGTYFEEYEGVKVYSVPMFIPMPSRLFKDSYYDIAARGIIRYVKRNRDLQGADWLYAHFLTDNGFIGAKVKDALKVKLAAIARGDDIHAWPEQNAALRPNLAHVFEKADLVLANSRNLGNDAHKWMQAGNIRNVDVVYNGIDHNQYRPAASEAERQMVRSRFKLRPGVHYMVCVATPVALKGWMELLHAIKDIGTGFEGWQLLMVAPRRLHHDAIDLHKVSEELGVAREVHYVGELSPADLAVLFRGCDAFILPSYNEGMANALLEAMASGLPCIATEVGGHNEVIANGVDGLLVPPRNVPALVAAIYVIIRDADLRQQMGVNARARMIAFGDYLQNAGKLLQLLSNHKY